MINWRQIGHMFFSAYCHEAGRNVLLGPDNFLDLLGGRPGFELHYRCHCGRTGVLHPDEPALAACA